MLGGAENPTAVANAGFVLSLFGVAMMAGRFITSAVKNLTAIGARLVLVAAVLSAGAIFLMIQTTSSAVAVGAIMLTGLVFAPIFPTIIGVTFAKFDQSLYGSIFGIMFSVGLLGATFVPKIVGNLSAGATVQQSLMIVLGMAVALVVVSLFLGVTGRKPQASA
jgi:fucose permease